MRRTRLPKAKAAQTLRRLQDRTFRHTLGYSLSCMAPFTKHAMKHFPFSARQYAEFTMIQNAIVSSLPRRDDRFRNPLHHAVPARTNAAGQGRHRNIIMLRSDTLTTPSQLRSPSRPSPARRNWLMRTDASEMSTRPSGPASPVIPPPEDVNLNGGCVTRDVCE
jgi:hypothetical protein